MSQLVATVILVASLAISVSAEPSVSSEDDGFPEMFFSESHMAECVSALDGLRERAHATVYEGAGAQFGADIPETTTSTGILMIYSVASEADSFYHWFSVSRSPFLATAFGKALVGLASLRFGLPAPLEIRLSPMQVYHAAWTLTPAEHAALLAAAPPEWPDPISIVAGEALLRTTFAEIVRFEVDYEELERLEEAIGESAN